MKFRLNKVHDIILLAYCILPLALVTGPFISEILLILIGCFGAFEFYKKKYSIIPIKKFIKFFLIFYIILIASAVFNNNPLATSLNIFPYLRFILFIIGGYLIIKDNNKFEKKLMILLLVTFLVLFFDSIYQFLFSKNIFNFPIIETGRVSSFFSEELILGSFTVRFLPIFLFLYLLKKKVKKFDINIIFIFAISVILILLSGERTAFYFLILQSVLMLIFIKNYNIEKIITIFLSLIIIITILLTDNKVKTRFLNDTIAHFTVDGTFSVGRSDHYTIFNDFKIVYKNQNIIYGVGPKNFEASCDKFKYFSMHEFKIEDKCATHPHNSYLQILNELGLLGLGLISFCFLYLVRELFLLNIRYRDKDYFNSQFCIILALLTSIFPLAQTGDFLNNWLSIVYYFPIPIYLKYKILLENKNN